MKQLVLPIVLRRPFLSSSDKKDALFASLSSEHGTGKTVKANLWPWLRPDSGLGFQVKVLKPFRAVLSLLGSGQGVGVEQLPHRNVKRFRGGLVCKALRLVYHSTLG